MTLSALGLRLREERQRVGLDQRAMAAVGGVSRNSQLAYEAGRTAPSSDYLFAVQREGVDVPFLFTGTRTESKNLGTVDDADWIRVSAYRLDVTDEGKGAAIGDAPFRKDWLNKAVGATTGLWLAVMPCDYPPAGLVEEDNVLCRDITAIELRERYLCIWREVEIGRLFVARFSAVRPEGVSIDQSGEYWVGRAAIAATPTQHAEIVPVARILARPIVQIR